MKSIARWMVPALVFLGVELMREVTVLMFLGHRVGVTDYVSNANGYVSNEGGF